MGGIWFLAGAALMVTLWLLLREVLRASDMPRGRWLHTIILGSLLGGLLVLAVSGRLNPILSLLAALVPFVPALRRLYRDGRAENRQPPEPDNSGISHGRFSQITTRSLRMRLYRDTDRIEGVILSGPGQGLPLDRLPLGGLHALHRHCLLHDGPSVPLLETWLDRMGAPQWRQQFAAMDAAARADPFVWTAPAPDESGFAADASKFTYGHHSEYTPKFSGSGHEAPDQHNDSVITRSDAWKILGLEPGAPPEAIKIAHRKLMLKLHPDHGGATHLAARVNRAKDILLKE